MTLVQLALHLPVLFELRVQLHCPQLSLLRLYLHLYLRPYDLCYEHGHYVTTRAKQQIVLLLPQHAHPRHHKFERRARAYRACLSNPENDTFVKIENAVKERKVHRNAADFDGKFIRETMQSA